MKDIDLQRFVVDLIAESDPEKRLALARQLRAGIWDMLGEEELEKIGNAGLDVSRLRGPVRRVK